MPGHALAAVGLLAASSSLHGDDLSVNDSARPRLRGPSVSSATDVTHTVDAAIVAAAALALARKHEEAARVK